jgi:hypothetical protein
VKLIAVLLEQFGQPLPAVGRLERDPGVAVELGQQLDEGLRIVDDPARKEKLPLIADHGDVRALAMQVDADRIHSWASSSPGSYAPEAYRSGTGAARRPAPSWHQIKCSPLSSFVPEFWWVRDKVGDKVRGGAGLPDRPASSLQRPPTRLAARRPPDPADRAAGAVRGRWRGCSGDSRVVTIWRRGSHASDVPKSARSNRHDRARVSANQTGPDI